ncbi:competence protein ComK [Bacillus luteolus]|uniref:Competence protein ComK n=1 Tax=Litchfieldia luteola TaxID=682179 RepID=A0ABR9QFC3_9BACI|nr:competence protein ComK [Cytobacillus luteolus]MBE4907111.1 competence protein ComK [Cytobacillus luteolus]MBP1943420.1 competence protein ComK [Cytobacillus luteolus]
MRKVTTYIICDHTIALIPIENGFTKIVTINEELYCTKSTIDIIKESYFQGNAFSEYRRTAILEMPSFSQRAPIPIKPHENLYFIPSHNPYNGECVWISYHHIKKVISIRSNYTLIIFGNYLVIRISVSADIIKDQLHKMTTNQRRWSSANKLSLWLDPLDRKVSKNEAE